MKTLKSLILSTSIFLAFGASQAQAKLSILTTIPDLAALAQEIGGKDVTVDSIAKGTQDPHFVEAKPSFMSKASKADLVVAVGLDLEVGYLPSILRGARNPSVMPGSKGFFEAGSVIEPIEKPSGKVSRSEGDVHPFGNPHFFLDPVRMGIVAEKLSQKMGELDPSHSEEYQRRGKAIQDRLNSKTKLWAERIKATHIKEVVTHHKTLSYFFDRFGINNPIQIEPKPGIPPTPSHTLEVIQLVKSRKIPLIMIENFFDPTPGNRITSEVPTARVVVVPVSVGGTPAIKTSDDLFEALVRAMEGK